MRVSSAAASMWCLGLALSLACPAAAGGASSAYVGLRQDSSGRWWFTAPGSGATFFSTGVANVNDGGADDGVGGVLSEPCQRQTGSELCGDTNNWDMQLGFAPYHNVTQALFDGNDTAFYDDAVARLRAWNFNTITGYSSAAAERAVGRAYDAATGNAPPMYYNRLLMFATRFAEPGGTPMQRSTANGCFAADVFDAAFERQSDAYARANVLPRATDPALLGWHFDKETHWTSMDLRYWFDPAFYPAGSAGLANATAWVRARYNGSIAAVNAAWGCDAASFAELPACIGGGSPCAGGTALSPTGAGALAADSLAYAPVFADRYLSVCHRAIRRYDANHLLFGPRGGGFGGAPPAVLRTLAAYVDLIDVHSYADADAASAHALLALYNTTHAASGGKPLLHGEFSFTSVDSGVPNFKGAQSWNVLDHSGAPCGKSAQRGPRRPRVLQRQRAAAAEALARVIASSPHVVGYHWWRWVDEAPGGRWPRSENSNYGLVRLDNSDYGLVTAALTRANTAAAALHANTNTQRNAEQA